MSTATIDCPVQRSRCLWIMLIVSVAALCGCSADSAKISSWLRFDKTKKHEVAALPEAPSQLPGRLGSVPTASLAAGRAPVASPAMPAGESLASAVTIPTNTTLTPALPATSTQPSQTPPNPSPPVPQGNHTASDSTSRVGQTASTSSTNHHLASSNSDGQTGAKTALASITSLASVAVPQPSATVSPIRRELNEFHSFPFMLNQRDLNGRPLRSEDLLGKVVVIDIWGTWCGPCRKAIPHLAKLQSKHAGKLQVIGLANEKTKNLATAANNVKQAALDLGINYPCALIDDQFTNSLPDFRGYPTLLFIDKTGRVRLKTVGVKPDSYWDAVVTELLSEPGPQTQPSSDGPVSRIANLPG